MNKNEINIFSKDPYLWRKISKWCICLFISCVAISGLQAQEKEPKVSLDLKKTSLIKIIEGLRVQTHYNFLFNSDELRHFSNITIKLDAVPLRKALDSLLIGNKTGLDYSIENRTVVIKKALSKEVKSITISGTVMDRKGVTLPGATVMVRGADNMGLATATDINGKYTLAIPSSAKVLVITFVGYKAQSVNIDGRTRIDITLDEDMQNVDEVVVTGRAGRPLGSNTGAVESFSKDEILRASNQNVLKALANLDASFFVVDNLAEGSNPNTQMQIEIRGTTTMPDVAGVYRANANQPLFILDGFETTIEEVQDLDMNRVQSISILKDAAAKVLYGAKAANGVVIIETVRPSAGRIRASYNGSLAMQFPDLSSYNLCDAEEKLQVEVAGGLYEHPNQNPYFEIAQKNAYHEVKDLVDKGVNTYWLSQPLRTQVGQNHSVSISGGDQRILYQINGSVNHISGVMKGSDRTTTTGGFSLTYRYKGLLVRNMMSASFNTANESLWGSFSQYARLNPYFTIHDPNGLINKWWNKWTFGGYEVIPNPMYNATLGEKDFKKYTRVSENLSAEYSFSENLRIQGSFAYAQRRGTGERFYSADNTRYIDPRSVEKNVREDLRGEYTINNDESVNWNGTLNLTYSRNFKEKHLIYVYLGGDMSHNREYGTGFTAIGLPSSEMKHIMFARYYSDKKKHTGTETTVRNLGMNLALNYTYADRYVVDFSMNRSGSSEFGEESRWNAYWAAGLAWNIHNERFVQEKLSFINQFRLRGSYGVVGSQGMSAYLSMGVLQYNMSEYYSGHIGSYLKALFNTALKGQMVYEQNYGLVLAMFKSKLNVTVDYYRRLTKDMLTTVSIPPSMGFPSYMDNFGEMRNVGYDVSVSYQIYKTKKSYLTVNVKLNNNKNKMVSVGKALDEYNKNTGSALDKYSPDEEVKAMQRKPPIQFVEGASVNAIRAVRSKGIDPQNGMEVFVKKDGTLTYEWNSDDLATVGNTRPKVNGLFGLTFQYSSLTLSMMGRFRIGGQIYNETLVNKIENADINWNVDRRLLYDRWNTPGQTSKYKSIKLWNQATRPTTRFMMDYDEFYVTTISASWYFPQRWVNKLKMERVGITLSSNDVFQWCSAGIERGTNYPFARNLDVKLSVNF